MEELHEHFERAFEAFGFAALPVNGGIGIVQTLNTIPREYATTQGFLRHVALPRGDSVQV